MKNDASYIYIALYLKQKMKNNEYNYILSKKKKEGFYIVDNPTVAFEKCDITDYLKFNGHYNKIVAEFNTILKNNFDVEYANTFNKNIKNVKIFDYKLNVFKKFTELFTGEAVVGSYDTIENQISVKKDKRQEFEQTRDTVMHELLHMASTKDIMFSGLSQDVMTKNGVKTVGEGINEGMTELLNKRYFSKSVESSYDELVQFAQELELIVGEDVLLDSYFKKGLPNLIKELTKYTNDESASLDLIISMDDLLSSKSGIFRKVKEDEIRTDLANIYLKKLDKEVTLGKIDYQKYQTKKYLNVDRYIAGDLVYSDDAFVIEENSMYHIQDGLFQKNVKIPENSKYNFQLNGIKKLQ